MMARFWLLGLKRHFFAFSSAIGTNSLGPDSASTVLMLPSSFKMELITTSPETRAERAISEYQRVLKTDQTQIFVVDDGTLRRQGKTGQAEEYRGQNANASKIHFTVFLLIEARENDSIPLSPHTKGIVSLPSASFSGLSSHMLKSWAIAGMSLSCTIWIEGKR